MPNPFEGLNLSAEQQTKLEALKTECQAQRKANAEARKADKQNRQKANKEEARKARTEQLAKIKAILTPEQYVQFLENNYLSTNRGGMKGKWRKPAKTAARTIVALRPAHPVATVRHPLLLQHSKNTSPLSL